MHIYTQGMGKMLKNIFEVITIENTAKTNVRVFRHNNLPYDIQRYVSNYQAYDDLSGKK
jgi:hypothetical protein